MPEGEILNSQLLHRSSQISN